MTSDELQALPKCLDGALPAAVRPLDLEDAQVEVKLPPSASGEPYSRLLALVREDGLPLGWASLAVDREGVAVLPTALTERTPPGRRTVTREMLAEHMDSPLLPLLTVVIATCANADRAVRCVEAILAGGHPSCEILVVENRPTSSPVFEALRERFGEDGQVRYVEEARPGLSSARNAGLREARGELIAFTDDDVAVDAGWIPALRAAFAAQPVDCVTGLIAPLELESQEQILLERFAGYGKGFEPRQYDLERPPADEPLFPYAAGHFVSGANIAFRTRALRELGGFDRALGTGTPARGCEDLDVCIRLLIGGGRLAYEPRAIVWHRHPDTYEGVRRRAFDYGAALGAMLAKHIVRGPDRKALLAKAPRALLYFLRPSSRKNAARGAGFPRDLLLLELVGLLYGPTAYALSLAVNR